MSASRLARSLAFGAGGGLVLGLGTVLGLRVVFEVTNGTDLCFLSVVAPVVWALPSAIAGYVTSPKVTTPKVTTPEVQPPAELPTVILFAGANPANTRRLALDEEVRSIEDKLRQANAGDRFQLETRWAVRKDDLALALLEVRPAILHFSGHGRRDLGLVLHGDNGAHEPLRGDELAAILRPHRSEVRVVLLNACESEEHARAVAKVIDVVVGMRSEMDDEAARVFAAAFYRAIAFGRPVTEALALGRSAVEVAALPGADVPVLVTGDAVDPGRPSLLVSAGPRAIGGR